MTRILCRWLLPALCILSSTSVKALETPLPMVDSVPATAPLPIDGVWRVSTLGKRVRIQQGRSFVVDPWRHLFVMQIQPNMVVVRDLHDAGGGAFGGYDLMALGAWRAVKNASGNLDVVVSGITPTRFQLIAVELDDPQGFAAVPVAGARSPSAAPGTTPAQPPSPPAAPEPAPSPAPQPAPVSPPAAAPDPALGTGAPTCREVIYQPDTDSYQCIQ